MLVSAVQDIVVQIEAPGLRVVCGRGLNGRSNDIREGGVHGKMH